MKVFAAAVLLSVLCSAQTPSATADLIWSARYVVTGDPALGVIEDGAIAVEGARIVGVGTRSQIEARFRAPTHLDQPNAILAPGLINTHTHAAMSLFRGIANDRKLQDWLDNFIFPAEAKNVDREFVRWGTRLALLEMARSGTTTFTDMYFFEDTVAEETKAAGMRGVLGQSLIGFPAPDFKTPAEQLAGAEAFLKKYDADPLITPAVAPHAIYTTPDETLRAARALADKYRKPLLIHLAETKAEYDEAKEERKLTPTQVLDNLGILGGPTVVAHAVWLDDRDIDVLAIHSTGVAHNPSSNMMLASGIAPVTKMLARAVNVGLGTDGPAGSNNDFDMFEEMDLAAKLQKVSTSDPTALSAQQAFQLATLGGAKALGMGHLIGSLEPGKLADIISIRLEDPRAAPLYDIYAQLVYALKGSDVGDVMVNGKMILRNRIMTTLNANAILAKAAEYGEKVKASLAK
ncbi:MAG: amidohydrolase family protein [Acidobacteriota bacterium]